MAGSSSVDAWVPGIARDAGACRLIFRAFSLFDVTCPGCSMKTMRWSFVFALLLVSVCGSLLSAQQTEEQQKLPFVHPLFSDHMVLQRDKPLNVWGWASPGSIVSVEIAGDSVSAKSNGTGKWTASIGPLSAGGPHKMKVSGPETCLLYTSPSPRDS